MSSDFNKYITIIKRICEKTEVGKKMLQKLLYLIERKGVGLNLNYSIHFFGPYSSKLDELIHLLESEDIIEIDTGGVTHKINMSKHIPEEYKETVEHYELSSADEAKVNFVLNTFIKKSAFELEAITTLDYVATFMLGEVHSDFQIIEEVKKIKGSKFKDDYLKQQLEILKKCGYVA